MKTTLFFIMIVAITAITKAQTSVFTDPRDGNEYRIAAWGDNTWMTENLNFATENSWVYADKMKNSKQNGRLYSWNAAMNACPTGWHLPTGKEWQELIDLNGGDLQAGLSLRIDGSSPFNARYSGFKNKDGQFVDFGDNANFWTATECDENDAWRCFIDRGFNNIVQNYFDKNGGLSVRCVQDHLNTNTFADKNGTK